MSRGRKNGNGRLVNQKYATVDEILPALQAKHATLLAVSRLRYETGKEPDPQLHDDMLLISSVIRKMARFGENIIRAEQAKKEVQKIEQERREWLERLCVLSIDMREQSTEMRHLATEIRYSLVRKHLSTPQEVVPDGT
jgi:hypothetical protein